MSYVGTSRSIIAEISGRAKERETVACFRGRIMTVTTGNTRKGGLKNDDTTRVSEPLKIGAFRSRPCRSTVTGGDSLR